MQFHPSREQRDLAASMDDALQSLLPLTRWHRQSHEMPDTWQQLTELGIFDISRPKSAGGVGLGATEEALIAISLGRCLAAPSVFATMGAAHIENNDAPPPFARVTAGVHTPRGVSIIDDPEAQGMIIRRENEARLYARTKPLTPCDGNPWIDPLALAPDIGTACANFSEAGLTRLMLIAAAALSGLAETALALAVDYSKIREQFGRPIGSFQAVKHHCADMLVAARSAVDLVTFAANAIDQGQDDAAFLTRSAFIVAADAATGNAAKNVQIHGGIGFSAEAEAHLFVKRAQILTALAGGVEAALDHLDLPQLENAA